MNLLTRYRIYRTRSARQERHHAYLLARRYLREVLAAPAPDTRHTLPMDTIIAGLRAERLALELADFENACNAAGPQAQGVFHPATQGATYGTRSQI
jgi:hypothetical protein